MVGGGTAVSPTVRCSSTDLYSKVLAAVRLEPAEPAVPGYLFRGSTVPRRTVGDGPNDGYSPAYHCSAVRQSESSPPAVLRRNGLRRAGPLGNLNRRAAVQRDKMAPKMGKVDIDYQALHDAFFRYQVRLSTLPQQQDMVPCGISCRVRYHAARRVPLSSAHECYGIGIRAPRLSAR